MKSNKPEVLSFDKWLKEQNQPASNFLRRETYEAGQKSKQTEIDALKMSNHYLSVQVIDAEAYSEHWKYERDKLQKRIDDAVNCLEQNKPSLKMEYKHAINALGILKGEETK